MHDTVVAVVTSTGVPVSIGRVRIHRGTSTTKPRVEIVFHTENVSCAVTIDVVSLELLSRGADGIPYRYRLPSGDKIWAADFGPRREVQTAAENQAAATANENQAKVETFPLPPASRLTGYPLASAITASAERAAAGAKHDDR